ncbi:MAG: hypothetical protein IPM18_17125 [Phycisphaerales bacterium]|nr:hypothetical protein [Phycisphaerales bacterium]
MRKQFMAALLAAGVCGALTAQASTFTFQGQVRQAGLPINGTADFQFRLYTAAEGGSQIGLTLTRTNVTVVDGLFTVELDYGLGAFPGAPRWIGISVRSPAGGGSYTTLAPRQPVRSAPYSIFALSTPESGFWLANGDHLYKGVVGNIGIGTSNPTWPLHVIENVSDGRGIFSTGTIAISRSTDAVGPGLRVFRNLGTFPLISSASMEIDGNRMDAYGTFVGSPNTIRLNSLAAGNVTLGEAGGNVGIGVASPGLRLSMVDAGVGMDRPTTNTLALYTDATQRLRISSVGNVGIGTTGPNSQLHVNGADGSNAFRVQVAGATKLLVHSNGNVGIGGNHTPSDALHINSPVGTHSLRAQVNGTTRLLVHDNGNVAIGANITPQDTLHVSGTMRTNTLRIMGGSDLSERFDVAELAAAKPSPGMVVCIDPANPGKLVPSTRSYDRTVAGVISGAGGIHSGMVMGQEGSEADGAFPVALTGRVYVLADAKNGAIQPGDLLTTADLPGHAMKVQDYTRAQGAIIGKAMTALAAGETGYVLVLVGLQ